MYGNVCVRVCVRACVCEGGGGGGGGERERQERERDTHTLKLTIKPSVILLPKSVVRKHLVCSANTMELIHSTAPVRLAQPWRQLVGVTLPMTSCFVKG